MSLISAACNEPYPIENAVLEPGDNLVGSVRRQTCLPGYLATGPITSTCAVPVGSPLPDWSIPVHFCKGKESNVINQMRHVTVAFVISEK